MLTLYRRHTEACPHKEKGRRWTRCNCPWWIDGTIRGREVRQSARTRKRDEAERELARLRGDLPEEMGVTIPGAVESWLRDLEARGLTTSSMKLYRRTAKRWESFCADKGIRELRQVRQADVAEHWQAWRLASLTAGKALERLSAFFGFTVARGWLSRNPMEGMKRPKVVQTPTLPYSRSDWAKLLAGCDTLTHTTAKARAKQARCLLLVMRYTGLRISDAVGLREGDIQGDMVPVRQEKTGVLIRVPVPGWVVAELATCPKVGRDHYFWTGRGKLASAVTVWQQTLALIHERSELPPEEGTVRVAHRCRDTFAVELLLAGVPLERVSRLLGHTSIKTTEKHYAPWVQERQRQAEEDVRRAWNEEGTKQVHESTKPN
jgi:integrase